MKRRTALLLAGALLGLSDRAGADPPPIDARWERWSLQAEARAAAPGGAGNRFAALRGGTLRAGGEGGGAHLLFAAAGRIDLSTPGALTFGVTPERWVRGPGGGYIPFVSVKGRGSSLFVIERARRDAQRGERLLAGYFDLRDAIDFSLDLALPPTWDAAGRHSVAVSWDAAGFAVSIDGGAFVRKAVPEGLVAAAFPPESTMLAIGSPGAETTLIDGLRVYSRAID